MSTCGLPQNNFFSFFTVCRKAPNNRFIQSYKLTALFRFFLTSWILYECSYKTEFIVEVMANKMRGFAKCIA